MKIQKLKSFDISKKYNNEKITSWSNSVKHKFLIRISGDMHVDIIFISLVLKMWSDISFPKNVAFK